MKYIITVKNLNRYTEEIFVSEKFYSPSIIAKKLFGVNGKDTVQGMVHSCRIEFISNGHVERRCIEVCSMVMHLKSCRLVSGEKCADALKEKFDSAKTYEP